MSFQIPSLRRRGVASVSYSLVLGFVALAGLGVLSGLGQNQRRLAGAVEQSMPAEGTPRPTARVPTVAPPEPTGPRVLFHTTFSTPKAIDGWLAMGSGLRNLWEVKDGSLHNRAGYRYSSWKPEQRIFVPGGPWEDYDVTVRATLHGGWGWGLYAGAQVEKGAWRPTATVFQMDPGLRPGAMIFRDVRNGRESRVKAIRRTPSFDFFGEPHDVTLRVRGRQVTAVVDGQEVLQYAAPGLRPGTVGLRTWGPRSGSIDFHELKVTAPR